MQILQRLYKQTAFILIPTALISAFIEWRRLPISIILGGVFGLLNLKGLSWGVESLLHSEKARVKLIVLSLLRFILLSAILIVLAIFRLINLFGLLIGFSIVFVLFMKEGLKISKEDIP